MRRSHSSFSVFARSAMAMVVALPLANCEEAPPREQWLVHVGTDAPIPGFGDRVRADVIAPDGSVCQDCTRVFDVGTSGAFPLSFGILPVKSGAPRVRLRLYRAEATGADGEPLDPIVDMVGRMPEANGGVTDVRAVLGMACFGKPADVAAGTSCDPSNGETGADPVLASGASPLPEPNSWGPTDEPCPDSIPEGMVCIPGGVFLLGNRTYVPFSTDFDPVPEQLVHVSTFLLDVDEATVGTYRSSVESGAAPLPDLADASHPYCQYTATPGAMEGASVNCLGQDDAAAACAALGKRLPTEAEWEFAAGNRTLETPYPWALANPSNAELCMRAIVARADVQDFTGSRACILEDASLVSGPQIGGSPGDVSELGIKNLGGNIAEWVADHHRPYADPSCWGPDVTLRSNPMCQVGTEGVARGGSYSSIVYNTHVFFRQPAPPTIREPSIGFRCAR